MTEPVDMTLYEKVKKSVYLTKKEIQQSIQEKKSIGRVTKFKK